MAKPEIIDADTDRYHRVDYSGAQLLNKFFTIKSHPTAKYSEGMDRILKNKKRSDRCNQCGSPNYKRTYAVKSGYVDDDGVLRSKSNDLPEYSTGCQDCGFECKTDEWGK